MHYVWQINMHEQYPTRYNADYLQSVSRSQEYIGPNIISPAHTAHESRQWYNQNGVIIEIDNENIKLNHQESLLSYGNVKFLLQHQFA